MRMIIFIQWKRIWGGGVPVMKDGQCIGAIAVSGLPEAEDMEIVELGVQAVLV